MLFLNQLFWYIYRIPVPLVLPMIALIVVIWGLLMRLLARRAPKAMRIVNIAAAVVALGGILYITVFRNNPGKQELILQPFQSFIEAKEQKEMFRELLMNVLLFVPFGLAFSYVLPWFSEHKKNGIGKCIVATELIALVFSVGIEVTQYFFLWDAVKRTI